MIDEEYFNRWVASAYPPTRALSGSESFWIKAAWLEATRRADRRAREECAEICKRKAESILEANLPRYQVEWILSAVNSFVDAIRATIAEDK